MLTLWGVMVAAVMTAVWLAKAAFRDEYLIVLSLGRRGRDVWYFESIDGYQYEARSPAEIPGALVRYGKKRVRAAAHLAWERLPRGVREARIFVSLS